MTHILNDLNWKSLKDKRQESRIIWICKHLHYRHQCRQQEKTSTDINSIYHMHEQMLLNNTLSPIPLEQHQPNDTREIS